MSERQRRSIFAVIFIVSLVVVVHLVFFTPSETTINTPTPTVVVEPASEMATPSRGA